MITSKYRTCVEGEQQLEEGNKFTERGGGGGGGGGGGADEAGGGGGGGGGDVGDIGIA